MYWIKVGGCAICVVMSIAIYTGFGKDAKNRSANFEAALLLDAGSICD